MTKSDSIGELSKALSKAQTIMGGAIKDSNNPFFKAAYADLSSVWDACRKPLTDNGLSIIQTLDIAEHGVIVETTLSHASGEWISGRLLLNPTKNDPQGIGSAITYGRRYALAAMVGVCPEDDDGEGAMGREDKKNNPKPEPKKETPEPKKDKNFAFLQAMGKEKARLGEELYYKILGSNGYSKSSEIIDRDAQVKVYNELLAEDDKK